MSNDLWRNRIVEVGEESPDQLLAHPQNWRIHPTEQQQVVLDLLDRVGWVQPILVNRVTGNVVNGHLRVMLALRRDEARVPVSYVELSEEEEREVLAALDPAADQAVPDAVQLAGLLADIGHTTAALDAMLQDLLRDATPRVTTTTDADSGRRELRVQFDTADELRDALVRISPPEQRTTKKSVIIAGSALTSVLVSQEASDE